MLRKKKIRIKTYLKRGDFVQIIAGAEGGARDSKVAQTRDAGRRGKIKSINYETGRVVIEGLNMRKKAMRPDPNRNRPGGIIEVEGSIHISNIMLVCAKDDKPVRVGIKIQPNGKKVRYCKHCQSHIGEEY